MFRWSIDESGIRNSSFGFLNLYYRAKLTRSTLKYRQKWQKFGGSENKENPCYSSCVQPICRIPDPSVLWSYSSAARLLISKLYLKMAMTSKAKLSDESVEKKILSRYWRQQPKGADQSGCLEAKNWEKFYYKDSAVIFFAATEIKWVSQFSN